MLIHLCEINRRCTFEEIYVRKITMVEKGNQILPQVEEEGNHNVLQKKKKVY